MSPKEYWDNLLRESQASGHLVFGGILVTYVGFALAREGLGHEDLLNFVVLLSVIHYFVKLTLGFPRDALNADMHSAIAVSLHSMALLVLIGFTAIMASKVGLNGDVLVAIQLTWLLLSTVDFVTIKGGAKVGSGQHD